MSYEAVQPNFYKMLQPDSAWHQGSPGWSTAPWPHWGVNPNLVGLPRLATNGLGCAPGKDCCDDCRGSTGEYTAAVPQWLGPACIVGGAMMLFYFVAKTTAPLRTA